MLMWCGVPVRAVPFNQRLLSSTPTRTKTRLTERHGVLLLNGSTETQILNSTDTAAAARPHSPVCAGQQPPCLCRGDVQFAAAPCHSTSSSSVASSNAHSCDSDVATHSALPLYSPAVAHRLNTPYYVPASSGRRPLSTSHPAIYTMSGADQRTAGIDACCRSDVPPAAMLSSRQQSASAGLHAASSAHSTAPWQPPQTVVGMSHIPVGMSHIPAGMSHIPAGTSHNPAVPSPMPCSCTSSAVTRPPAAAVTSSSSQDTIEIHLERSPRRSEPQEAQLAVLRRGTEAAVDNRRPPHRRPRPRGTAAARRRHSSARCDSVSDSMRLKSLRRHGGGGGADRLASLQSGSNISDTATLRSLLTQLKVVVAGNRDAEVGRLLSELCETQVSSPSQTKLKTIVSDSTPDQLHVDITHLNRSVCSFLVFPVAVQYLPRDWLAKPPQNDPCCAEWVIKPCSMFQ